jgi:hypothetical protein
LGLPYLGWRGLSPLFGLARSFVIFVIDKLLLIIMIIIIGGGLQAISTDQDRAKSISASNA